MNYYEARQREKDRKWDYTCRNDGRTWPIGYCATTCNGHDTKEQAEECYRLYLIDNARYSNIPLDEDKRPSHRKCMVCGTWTMSSANVSNMSEYYLCPDHLNQDSLLQIVERPGYIISSC